MLSTREVHIKGYFGNAATKRIYRITNNNPLLTIQMRGRDHAMTKSNFPSRQSNC